MDDLLWIGPALLSGIAASRFGLPPMVGYLLCGFALNFSGVVDHARLTMIGDMGVTLLLFTIGLKLDLRSLLRPVIWAGTTMHTAVVVAAFGILLYLLSLAGIQALGDLDLRTAALIGFALSFSSTVFAVKTLEDKGEYQSKHGQIAIGVLIMQDIFAVIFLAASTGKLPSVWAFGLLALGPMRYVLMHLLSRAGHNAELQVLYGIALAFGGYTLFDAVDVKGDLGALIIGSLLASHPLAGEVSKRLLGFKDLLLVGFFLSIGMSGNLTIAAAIIALFLTVLVVFKVVLYVLVFTRFHMRGRMATLSSLTLANYSEFGLIVGAIAVTNGWLTEDWLVTIALALTMTIIIAAPVSLRSNRLYLRWRSRVRKWETDTVLPEDSPPDLGKANTIVIGMGPFGAAVYDRLACENGDGLIGIDSDPEVVAAHVEAGRRVVPADATDAEMWQGTKDVPLEVAILALKNHQENLALTTRILESHPKVTLFAVARHNDEVNELVDAGAKSAWNLYSEAGVGLGFEVAAYLDAERSRK